MADQPAARIQVLAKADVLGLPVDAAYQRKENNSSEIVVYGSVPNPKPMSLADLLTELGNLVTLGTVKPATITDALPSTLATLKHITFSLDLVYFRRKSKAPANTSDPTPTAPIGSDYAFEVSVNLGGVSADFPMKVLSMSFKIWTTTNAQVLEEMGITKFNKLLETPTA